MKKFYRFLTIIFITIIFITLICFSFVPVALAHPLGNFTVNHYAGLQISPSMITIDYVMDMAEVPAFQEIELLDNNGNRQPDPEEAAKYHPVRCDSLRPSLNLLLNREELKLSLISSSIAFPAGVGGLPTMRLTCEFQAPISVTEGAFVLSFHNGVFADRPGWQEIVVIPDGVNVQEEYSSASPSNQLRSYPQDLLTSPLAQRDIELDVILAGVPAPDPLAGPLNASSPTQADRNDAFTRLILMEEITFPALLLSLAVSFIWGAMHAMTPGHGKTIVGAYLVGSRGTMKHALYLGLTTTITHTLGVFALGLVTLFAAQYIVPESLYPWMSLLSGLFVVGIGLNLFLSRFRSSGMALPRFRVNATKRSLSPVFEHSHAETAHSHKYVLNVSPEHLHIHDHDHPHVHRHDDHEHHGHDHGNHSRMPPEQITWRSLLALGVSGGLIPCPSALIVLLGAIALNRIGFGLILVLAFSLGLAGALTAIGMLFIYAGRLFERFPSQGRIIRFLPMVSALFVSALGAAIIWKALGEMGVI